MDMKTLSNHKSPQECPDDKTLQEDLESIVFSEIPFEMMDGKTVLVTGATGLVGTSVIRALLCIARLKSYNIKILGMIRNENKAISIYGPLMERANFRVVVGDINNPIRLDEEIDYIIHCASVTASSIMVNKPVETLMTSVIGTKNILDLAKQKKCRSVVYISSMEMYGTFEFSNHYIHENEVGFIDPLSIRSNYPESKRLCENMCVAYLKEYGIPIKIARLAQTFGAGILEGEDRVFAQFAKSVLNNQDIILHTSGESEGNYCYTRDMVKGVFTILLKGIDGEAYNVVNPSAHTTIKNMAKLVAEEVADGKIQVLFDIPNKELYGYAPNIKMKLSADKLMGLGWVPEIGLKEAYERMIQSMRSQKSWWRK